MLRPTTPAARADEATRGPTTRGLAFAALLTPLAFVVLASLGAPFGAALGGAVLLAAVATAGAQAVLGGSAAPGDRAGSLLLWLASFAWLVWIHRAGTAIRGPDVLLVPGIAQSLTETASPHRAFVPAEPGYAYPPGLPVAFTPLTLLLSGPHQVMAWGLLTHAAQAALPLLWASALRRWFHLAIEPLTLALILLASMLCLERTVVLGGAFKNVHHVAIGGLLPGALLLLPRRPGWRPLLASTLVIASLVTAYYSMLHLFIAWVTAWAATDVGLRRRLTRRTRSGVTASAVASVLAGCALLGWVGGDLGDARTPGETFDGWRTLHRIALDPKEKFWFVFGALSDDGSNAASGIRRATLAACVILTLGVTRLPAWLPRRSGRLPLELVAVARMASAMAITCLVVGAMVALGPLTRLSFDYGRWLLYAPQTAILAAPFLSIALILRSQLGGRVAVAAAIAGMLALGLPAHLADVERTRLRATQGGVAVADLRALSDELGATPGCRLVAQSQPIADGLHHVGAHPLSDTVDVVSPCRLTGGSFLRVPLPEGRALGGLPTGAALAEWSRTDPLWAIGAPGLIRELAARQPGLGWRAVRDFGDPRAMLWRAEAKARTTVGPAPMERPNDLR